MPQFTAVNRVSPCMIACERVCDVHTHALGLARACVCVASPDGYICTSEFHYAWIDPSSCFNTTHQHRLASNRSFLDDSFFFICSHSMLGIIRSPITHRTSLGRYSSLSQTFPTIRRFCRDGSFPVQPRSTGMLAASQAYRAFTSLF